MTDQCKPECKPLLNQHDGADMVTKPQVIDNEWFGLDEDGLRFIVRRRENSEVSQVSVTVLKEKSDGTTN